MSDDLTDLNTRYQRLSLLYQVSNTIHSTLDPQEALQLILREALRLMRATSGSVVLINPNDDFLEIHAFHGLSPVASQMKLKVGEGITGWVAKTGHPALVGDVHADARYIMVRQDVQSELAVPLIVEGKVRGVLNVDSRVPNAFTTEDQSLLEELSVQAAKVIHNTWLYEQLRRKAMLFETLASVGKTINSTLNVDEALSVITRETAQLMESKMCSLLLLDETREWLEVRASHGAGEAYLRKARISVGDSLLGIVVRRQKPVQELNVQISSRYQNIQVAREEGLCSLLGVPLMNGERVTGVLCVYTGLPHRFSNEEVRILHAAAELSGIALEKARLYDQVVRVEEQLRQSEKLSALGLLAAEVAHEIRNPLTVMKMLYHSMNLRFAPEDPRARDAVIMGEKMDHLNKIVEQVLDFARRDEPKPERLSVNSLIEDLRLLTRHKFKHHNVRLSLKLDPNLPKVMADATQLEQAFLNLMLNAIEAMPRGGELVLVTQPARQGADRAGIVIDFRDNGVGMSEEQRRNAFSSLLGTTKPQGTGLGLAIVRRVVEAHRGELRIRSRKGRGTSISVILPLD